MKLSVLTLAAILTLTLLATSASAQRPEGREGPPRGERGPGDRGPGRDGGPPRGFPVHPLVGALDTDGDGEISASEIEKAAAALKKLDKDKDGRLSRTELRPQRPEGGRDRGREGGRFGGPPPREGGNRPDRAGDFVSRIMQNDKNGDGKVSKAEMPERMKRIFDRVDSNSDGAVDKEEAEKMAARFREGGRRPAGDGDRDGDRDNNRPTRPARDR